MMEKLYAKSAPEWTPLKNHLEHVAMAAKKFATHTGMDETLAYNGAILHDIGKAHPEFQKRLKLNFRSSKTFRHEISSLLFLSAFQKHECQALIEMVVGHHKSVKNDVGNKGLLDLEENEDYEDFHIGNWNEWSGRAFSLLNELGVACSPFTEKDARTNLASVIQFCNQQTRKREISKWRGLLMGADHFASSLIDKTKGSLTYTFQKPNLSFFNRTHPLYPLSFKDASSCKRHTIVVACTGAGKTDFLFRRTKGRVFYTLPFQASINAMFERIKKDLGPANPNLDIRVLHASSTIMNKNGKEEEVALQSLFGSSIKILTPHQLATIAFGLKGFESMILDLEGSDIVLDEIHTYTGISQSIVLKLVQILKSINCRIHIGTATMPTILYNKVLEILGDDVLEIKLSKEEMDKFDRHIIHKIKSIEASVDIIEAAVLNDEKVLVIFNTVSKAQEFHKTIKGKYPAIPMLLLHSRFKRGDRSKKEKLLLGMDENGRPTGEYNTSTEACIVISTQIVEVSLDISFDLMITEVAPIDALIQRFGRVNRKRKVDTIGKLKNVFVMQPPETNKNALPYDLEVLKRSFEVLPDGKVLKESELQAKIDYVFPTIDFMNIEEHAVFKSDGRILIDKLTHRSKSILLELLDIDSVSCITEQDRMKFEDSYFEERMEMEIPARYFSVNKMTQSQKGSKPFIVPDRAYDPELGLDLKLINEKNLDVNYQIL
jgi:CRISPR-associated endonuclease/helicase Cas3